MIDLIESSTFANFKIVTHYRDCAVSQWLFKRLGLEERIVQKPINADDGFVISTGMAFFPHFEPCLHAFGLFPRFTLLPIQKRLGVLDGTHQDLIVYLSRNNNRSVADESNLLTVVKQFVESAGYEFYIFHASGNFDHDLEVMKRAKVILGPHGGAFANIAFAQPGTHVVEFLPIYKSFAESEGNARRNFWGLSQAAGLDYWALDPEWFDFDKPGMVVDVAKVVDLLRKIL